MGEIVAETFVPIRPSPVPAHRLGISHKQNWAWVLLLFPHLQYVFCIFIFQIHWFPQIWFAKLTRPVCANSILYSHTGFYKCPRECQSHRINYLSETIIEDWKAAQNTVLFCPRNSEDVTSTLDGRNIEVNDKNQGISYLLYSHLFIW